MNLTGIHPIPWPIDIRPHGKRHFRCPIYGRPSSSTCPEVRAFCIGPVGVSLAGVYAYAIMYVRGQGVLRNGLGARFFARGAGAWVRAAAGRAAFGVEMRGGAVC